MARRTPLRERTAVVTGAGSGIGRALALDLAARRCRLAICDVNAVGLARTAELAEAAGAVEVVATHVDVADRAAVEAYAAATVAHFGVVHLLVNNAGVALGAQCVEQGLDDVEWVLDINLRGVIYGSQAFLPHLIASGDGHLVNISSIFGIITVPAQSAYHAAKFGVRGYTESLAMEARIARLPLQVHCVHPGGIATSIAANARTAAGVDPTATAQLFSRVAKTSPARAAAVILTGVERGRSRIMIGADARVMAAVSHLPTPLYQHLVVGLGRRVLQELQPGGATVATPAQDDDVAVEEVAR